MSAILTSENARIADETILPFSFQSDTRGYEQYRKRT